MLVLLQEAKVVISILVQIKSFVQLIYNKQSYTQNKVQFLAHGLGETKSIDITVNYTPCGHHCRQFMNELNSAETLKIHLPHSQNNSLHQYLLDSFGPQNLDIDNRLFDKKRMDCVFPQKILLFKQL